VKKRSRLIDRIEFLPKVLALTDFLEFVNAAKEVNVRGPKNFENVNECDRLNGERTAINVVAKKEVACSVGKTVFCNNAKEIEEMAGEIADDDDRGGECEERRGGAQDFCDFGEKLFNNWKRDKGQSEAEFAIAIFSHGCRQEGFVKSED
jgi:hypothetical protein